MINTQRRKSSTRILLAGILVLALGLVGCSNKSDESTRTTVVQSTTTAKGDSTTTAAAKKLTILVSNDDGYNAPGIDALVDTLKKMPDTEVVIAAPATQQSGKGSTVTEGELNATEEKTISGVPAFAVQGTPADSVNWALNGGIKVTPDLVITGINAGQNLGTIADVVSGTVGAARAATSHGIPALATSLGSDNTANINEVIDTSAFATAAQFVVDWVKEHRDRLLSGEYKGDEPLLENLNVPICSAGKPRGVARVELAKTGENAIAAQNCESTVPQPADDITAFNNGFVTLSPLPLVPPAG